MRVPGEVATNTPIDAFNPFNPFNQIISGGTRARIFDFGNRLFDNENEAWLTTLGVKGDKLFDGNWGYDGGFRYSQIYTISQDQTRVGLRVSIASSMRTTRSSIRLRISSSERRLRSIHSAISAFRFLRTRHRSISRRYIRKTLIPRS